MSSATAVESAAVPRRWTTLFVAAAAIALGWLAWNGATPAHAALGDLTFESCDAEGGNAGCAAPANAAMNGAFGVAVKPNDRSVYVTTITDDSLVHYTRQPGGELSYEGCVSNAGNAGCADPANDSLDGARGVAVSPDGGSVYVASSDDDSVTHFTTNATGQLTFESCIADGGASGCSSASSLDGAFDVEVSPDGNEVYVASQVDDSVTHFARGGSGALTFEDCVADGGGSGCAGPASDSLDGAIDVAASPDGQSMYVSSPGDDSVTSFTVGGGGALSFQGCVADAGGSGCDDPTIDSLDGTRGLDVSPDGESVYVASGTDNAVTNLSRASNGAISFHSCISESGGSGCADPPTDSLNGPIGVAVSPDGETVYAASAGTDNSLTHLNRGTKGALSFAGCVAEAGASGCVDPPNDAFNQARGVAVSNNGRSVYLAAGLDNAITHLTRAVPTNDRLVYDSCFADNGGSGCANPSSDALNGALGVTASSDGKSVYVVSEVDRSLNVFTRGANGELGFHSCFTFSSGASIAGCTTVPTGTLSTANSVAVSPDGKNVYVTAGGSGIAWFSRAPSGALTYENCKASTGTACLSPNIAALGGARGIVVSPDGGSVYVTGSNSDAVIHFSRAADGTPTFASCVADNGGSGCANPPTDSLNGARGIAISPDGGSLYVTSGEGDAVTHLTLGVGGTPTFQGCVAEAGASGCSDPSTDSLDGARGVAVSPDNESVYVASVGDHSLTHLTRAPGGAITFQGCIAEAGGSGCADPSIDSLQGAAGVALSPDGSSLYVTAENDASVTRFTRGALGAPVLESCVANSGASGCADPAQDSLTGANGIAVSPGGESIYVASIGADSVTHLGTGPDAPTITGTDPDSPANDNDPSVQGTLGGGSPTTVRLYVDDAACAGTADYEGSASEFTGTGIGIAAADDDTLTIRARAIDADGSKSPCSAPFDYVEDSTPPDTQIDSGPTGTTNDDTPTFAFSATGGGSSFECRVDSDPFASCTSPHTTAALSDGAHTFEVQATDDAGNVDPTPASRNFTVATLGKLTPSDCVMDDETGADACGQTSSGLDNAQGVAVSSDGKSVYTVSIDDDSIVRFDRDPSTGALTPQQCIEDIDGPENGCGTTEGLNGARSVDVSDDGKSVYVAGRFDDAVVRFNRDTATGAITPAGCLADDDTGVTCGNYGAGLDGPTGVTVSPDGRTVYVAGHEDDAVARLTRNTTTGALSTQSCIDDNDTGDDLCTQTTNGLDGALTLAHSPNGQSLYATAFTDDAIVRFNRNTTSGALTPQNCIDDNDTGADTCAQTADGLDTPTSVAVSSDGTSTYVTSEGDDAIVELDRDPGTGAITPGSCVDDNDSGADTCAQSADALNGAQTVAVAEDGASAYVASFNDQAVVRFDRAGGGALTPKGCVDDNDTGPEPCSQSTDGLRSAFGLAASPDGRSLYATSAFGDDAVVRLQRERAPQTTIDSGPSDPTNDATPTFTFSADEPGSTFECRVDSDPFATCTSPHTTASLSDAQHTFEVRAVKPSGNVDGTPASQTFTVDTQAPDPPTITDTDPDSPANDDEPEVKGTVGAGAPTAVKLYENASCTGSPDASGSVSAFTGGGISVSVAPDQITDLSARTTDAAGNDSGCSNSISYEEDSTEPDTTIDDGPDNPTNDTTPTFEFSSNEGGASFECRVDAEAFAACTSPHTTEPLNDGERTFEVRATDGASNVDATPASQTFTVDTVAQAPPTITDTDPDSPADDDQPEVKGTDAEAGSTVRIYTDPTCTQPPIGTGTAADFNGATGVTATVPEDDTTVLRATAELAGNESPCSEPFDYTEDSTDPDAPAITDTDPDSPAHDRNPEVKGTAEAGATVKLYSTDDCTGGSVAEGTSSEFAAGLTVNVADDVATTLTATATDGAGHVSDCSDEFEYTDLADAGDFGFTSCVAENGASGCADPSTDSLDGAFDVATSPDGSSVYVVSQDDHSVTHLSRDSNGDMAFDSCVAQNGGSGCANPSTDSLQGTRSVVVSPDGESVYVASIGDSAVTHFTRAPDGELSFESCISDGPVAGCVNPPHQGLLTANQLAISPDGESLYATTFSADSIVVLDLSASGSPSFDSCIADNGLSGCDDPPTDTLFGSWGVDVSPDGGSVYVAARGESAVTHFNRAPGGGLSFDSCIAENGNAGCANPPTDSLDLVAGLAASPDGEAVYVAAENDESVTRLARDESGDLSFDSCVANNGGSGCADPEHDSLGQAFDLAVSPDSESVYATAAAGDSVTHFAAGAGTGLDFESCVAELGEAGCADPSIDSLKSPIGITVSSDGRSVYAAAAEDDSVTHLARTTIDTPTITDTDPGSPGNDDQPEVKGTVGDGSPVEVRLYADDPLCTGSSDAQGTVAEFTGAGIELEVAEDASTAIRARAVDGSGDRSACSAPFAYVEDSTAPQTTIDDGPSGPINDDTPTFEFSADESNSTFECRVDSDPFDDCTSPHETTQLDEGAHTFEVRATDEADNTDGSPASSTFSVDTAAPDAPEITDTDPDSPANDNSPEVKGSAESGSTVRLYESDDCTGDVEAQGSASEFEDPGLTATVDGDDTATFTAIASDGANDSACSAPFSYVEDSTAPDTTIDTGPSGDTGDSTPEFTFSSTESGSSFECRVNSNPFADCDSPHVTETLDEGAHTFEVRATDEADNTDPSADSRSFSVDTGAPDTTITVTPPSQSSDNTPTFQFTSDDSAADFECRVDSAPFADCTSPHTTAALADGERTFEVRAVDASDNVDPTPASVTLTVDTAAPSAPAITDTDPNSPANDTSPQLKGSAEAGSTVRLYSDASCTGTVRAQGGASAFASPGLTVNVPNGSTTSFRATATDAAGNVSGCSAARTYVETNPSSPPAADTDPPETEITLGPKPKTKKKKASFEFSADEDATFECSLDGKGFSPCTSPHTLKAKKKGKHVLEVQATDEAGNADPTPAEHRWKLKKKK